MNYTAAQRKIIFAALAVLPLFTALICLGFGRYALGVFDTVRILFSGVTKAEITAVERSVIFSVRLPRIILAAFVGAGLRIRSRRPIRSEWQAAHPSARYRRFFFEAI